MLDDARHLDWGYAPYPPLLPFPGRIERLLFGPSLVGFRVFAALAQCAAMVLAGLITHELEGTSFRAGRRSRGNRLYAVLAGDE